MLEPIRVASFHAHSAAPSKRPRFRLRTVKRLWYAFRPRGNYDGRSPMKPTNRLIATAAITLYIALIFAGCSRGQEPSAAAPAAGAASGAPSQEALVLLAKADAADGTVDKVVTKCVVCMLGMDGSAEHSASYGGYQLHFCSEDCKESFTKNPEQSLLALKFPEEKQ